MTGANSYTHSGGLSRWPRMLFLGTAALALAALVGLWAYGLVVGKSISPNAAGTLLIGVFAHG